MMLSSFFIDTWFIYIFFDLFTYVYVLSFIEIVMLISDFIQHLNSNTSSLSLLSGQAFVLILLQELWSYIHFKLFMAILHYMTL